MAGHSKWANIRHRKGKQDARRGNLFSKLSRALTVAAREGGGNPETNVKLRLALQKAKEANMPADTIMAAIRRGTGELQGEALEEIVYEGYGPGGVAILLEAVTDNRNRTAAEVRHLFSRFGGSLGESGCVAWMFEKKAYVFVERSGCPLAEDELLEAALEGGAEDLRAEDDGWEITGEPSALESIKAALKRRDVRPQIAEVTMVPKSTVSVSGPTGQKVLRLLEALEEHDDIQQVYSNFDMEAAEMKKYAG